jgi:hypothetical protein
LNPDVLLKKNQIYSFYVDNTGNDSQGEIICNYAKSCNNIDISTSISNEFLEISKVNMTERYNSFKLFSPIYVGNYY